MNNDLQEFLTPKQLLFCNEYLVDMNATRAALRAGYSASTALNGQLMHMPKIKCYLDMHVQQRAERVQFTHDMVLRELGKIAFGNMGDYFAADGTIKPMNAVSDDAKAALWSVSISDDGSGGTMNCTTKFRMYNKLSALDKIAKHIGFYNPEVKPAEPVFAYLNTEQLTADDRFDDAKLQEEIRLKKMLEARIRSQELAKIRREGIKMERERLAALAPKVGDGVEKDDAMQDENTLRADVAEVSDESLPQVVAPVAAVPAVVAPSVNPVAPLYGKLMTKEEIAQRAKERWMRENPPKYLVY